MDQLSTTITGRADGADESRFRELLERRDRVQGWIARLDGASGVSARVTERVRGDYESQLQTIMDELAGHENELREQRAHLDEAILEAEAASAEARDALEEAELRFSVGELDESAWEARRAELAPGAEAAAVAVEDLRARAESLSEVIDEIRTGSGGIPAEPLPPLHSPGVVSDPVGTGPDAARPPGPAPDGDDGAVIPAAEDSEATRPAPGVKCVECGYTNDFGALYCGVCGVEIS